MKYFLLGCFLFLSVCAPAHAQSACAPRDSVVERLADKFGEVLAGQGLSGSENIVELFINSNNEKRTFTVLISNINGNSCLLSAGRMWTPVESPLPKKGIKVKN